MISSPRLGAKDYSGLRLMLRICKCVIRFTDIRNKPAITLTPVHLLPYELLKRVDSGIVHSWPSFSVSITQLAELDTEIKEAKEIEKRF